MPALTASRASARLRASAFAGRSLRCSASNGATASMKALWLPGADTPKLNPSYLDGSLPGDFGFDPLGLASTPELLARFREAELIHCRWAMLGAAGVIAVEALGYGDWISAQTQVPQTYFGQVVPWASADLNVITASVVLGVAFAESARQNEANPMKRLYPGGAFDPLKLSAGAGFEKAKVQEVKNGRLAMVAFLGFVGQAYSTDTTPLANLAAHLADPWHASVAQNAVALPFL